MSKVTVEEVSDYSGPPLDDAQVAVLAAMYRLARGRTDISVSKTDVISEAQRYSRLSPEGKQAYDEESSRIADKERS